MGSSPREIKTPDLLAEVERRLGYTMAGWQESYRSAQFWRREAEKLRKELRGLRGEEE